MQTFWATFSDGKVKLLEQIEVPDGTRVLVTIFADDDTTDRNSLIAMTQN